MKLNWGILGTGAIAGTFAKGMKACNNGNLVAVGSRVLDRARMLTDDHGGKPYGSYDDMLGDPTVEAVYIALPHHMHMEYTIKCAQAGKHILCEKPFTLNALEAERALKAVREADVFFMEAWMYRSHPQTLKVMALIRDGAIGEPKVIHAEFGYAAGRDWEHFKADAAVGGGALLDVGSYCVSFCRLVADAEPTRCEYSCSFVRGYDGLGVGIVEFPGELRASFATGIHADLANSATVFGETGRIHLPSPWFCGGPILLDDEPIPFESVPDLWGNQAGVVARHLADRQAPTMTWADSLGNMRTLDALRASAGLAFAEETKA